MTEKHTQERSAATGPGDVSPSPLARVLAVHPGALGDVLLLGRFAPQFAGAVTLVASAATGRLLAGLGAVERAVDIDLLPLQELFADRPVGQCRLPRLLGAFGRVVTCLGDSDRDRRRWGQFTGAGRVDCLPIRPPGDFDGHLLELWAQSLAEQDGPKASGGVSLDLRAPWPVPSAWQEEARTELRRLGVSADRPLIVLHPGAGSPAKCWPIDRFLTLARRLAAEGAAPVVVLGPVELDRWRGEVVQALHEAAPVLGQPPLELLTGVLAQASHFVGNDSGVSHLAGLVGTPTTSLFGPTRPEHFQPLGPNVRVIRATTMEAISVQRVAEMVLASP